MLKFPFRVILLLIRRSSQTKRSFQKVLLSFNILCSLVFAHMNNMSVSEPLGFLHVVSAIFLNVSIPIKNSGLIAMGKRSSLYGTSLLFPLIPLRVFYLQQICEKILMLTFEIKEERA
jgi:hypothetical protein